VTRSTRFFPEILLEPYRADIIAVINGLLFMEEIHEDKSNDYNWYPYFERSCPVNNRVS
jgi:hypothetical protein